MFHIRDIIVWLVNINGLVVLDPDGSAQPMVTARHSLDGTFQASSATAQCADVDGDGRGDLLTSLTLDFEHVGSDPSRAQADLVVMGESDRPNAFELAVFWNGEFAGYAVLMEPGR